MSSTMKFITNAKGDGDWCIVTLNGEIIHEGHELSFYRAYQLMQYYGSSFDSIYYIETSNEELENYV